MANAKNGLYMTDLANPPNEHPERRSMTLNPVRMMDRPPSVGNDVYESNITRCGRLNSHFPVTTPDSSVSARTMGRRLNKSVCQRILDASCSIPLDPS